MLHGIFYRIHPKISFGILFVGHPVYILCIYNFFLKIFLFIQISHWTQDKMRNKYIHTLYTLTIMVQRYLRTKLRSFIRIFLKIFKKSNHKDIRAIQIYYIVISKNKNSLQIVNSLPSHTLLLCNNHI